MKSVLLQAAKETFSTDENPVFGLYYFAKGGKIDEGKSEVVDKNDYYVAAQNMSNE